MNSKRSDILYLLGINFLSEKGYVPLSSKRIAEILGISVNSVKYNARRLRNRNLIEHDYYGDVTESGNVYCIHGYSISNLGKLTTEFERACIDMRDGNCKYKL